MKLRDEVERVFRVVSRALLNDGHGYRMPIDMDLSMLEFRPGRQKMINSWVEYLVKLYQMRMFT